MKNVSFKIVNDINIGLEINKNYNEYCWIKTEKQSNEWKKKVLKFKSGTYGQNNLLETIEYFIKPLTMSELSKDNHNYKYYIEDLKKILFI